MESLITYNRELVQTIERLNASAFSDRRQFDFNTAALQEYTGRQSAGNCPIWLAFFKEYASVSQPVVYWFEKIHGPDNHTIFQHAQQYKKAKLRNFPAMRREKQIDWNTPNMYVGCCSIVRFRDRVHQHFGYYVEERTQGLQLCHWARPSAMQLRLHALVLPHELSPLATLYEKHLAREFRPLIGIHK